MLIRNVNITASGFPGMFAGSLATPRLGATEVTIENTGQDEAEWLLIGPAGMQFFLPNGEEVVTEWAQ